MDKDEEKLIAAAYMLIRLIEAGGTYDDAEVYAACRRLRLACAACEV